MYRNDTYYKAFVNRRQSLHFSLKFLHLQRSCIYRNASYNEVILKPLGIKEHKFLTYLKQIGY